MAIAYLGQQRLPATDDANVTSATNTLDKDVAPFSTLSTGNFVLVLSQFKSSGSTSSATTTGGQTWTEAHDNTHNTIQVGLYWCIFNGTWDADPVFTNTGAASPNNMWALAYSGVDQSTPFDVAKSITNAAAATTFVEADWSTVSNDALAFVVGGSVDNNTWTVDNSFTAPAGSGNIYWRTSGGTDGSIVVCVKPMAVAGAVGQTTMTQATLGGDAGYKGHWALKADASVSQTVTPATVSVVVGIDLPSITRSSAPTPPTVAATAAVPLPEIQTGTPQTVTPDTVAAVTSVPLPGIEAGSTVLASTVAAIVAVPSVAVTMTANVATAVVEAIANIFAPTIDTGEAAPVDETFPGTLLRFIRRGRH